MPTVYDSGPTVHDCHSDAHVGYAPTDSDWADYNAYLDDLAAKRALLDDGPTEPQLPEPRYISSISINGRKFVASVTTPDGRKIKCGVWPTERQAWIAADRKVAELREGRAA